MKRIVFILPMLLFVLYGIDATPVFSADCRAGLAGTRTTFGSGKFSQSTDNVSSLSFLIDDAEPQIMILEQRKSGIVLRTERLMIVNSTENLIQAIAINGESIQVYTILRKTKVLFYSNQRADFVGNTAVFPSLISAMWGIVDISYDNFN